MPLGSPMGTDAASESSSVFESQVPDLRAILALLASRCQGS
eukprot:CAMPEP_0204004462 /NCGR_PEP_ID=MMETSP0360-20130528/18387_1 /ASSEMBLY_ACC=CAM_ASM_000342 /TAXON_ID=268821 /ORGANISM="Scrippsiella Hangoei, Strain SHTV-5" /LENGTH=40 /DNA_ID= /DNA_START= /DNA_END= /DNA_ORIENTATION=